MKQLSILLFIESGGPGGAERVVLELAQGLRDANCNVELAGLRTGWFTEKAKELNFIHHLIKNSSSFQLPFQISALIKKQGYNILHSHLVDSNFYCSLASRISATAHIATEHGDVHHIKKKKFLKTKIRLAEICGTHFCAVSNFTKNKILELGVSSKNVSVIGNPFTELKINHTRQDVRASLGIDNNQWLWIQVANLRPVKDQACLLKALAKSKIDHKLLIVGDGPLDSELKQLAQELKITSKVFFLGHRQDIGDLLNACDGFVLSSISEAMPMSLLEAGSLGLVLAGSNVGGIPEVIKNHDFLFPSGDHLMLAKILDQHLRRDPAIKNFISQNFSRKKVVENYLELYKLRLS